MTESLSGGAETPKRLRNGGGSARGAKRAGTTTRSASHPTPSPSAPVNCASGGRRTHGAASSVIEERLEVASVQRQRTDFTIFSVWRSSFWESSFSCVADEKTSTLAFADEDRETLADLAVIHVRFANGRLLQRFLPPGSYTIGRRHADVTLSEDHRVSALHARLEITPGRVFITDLGSTNGTWDSLGQRLVGRHQLAAGEPVTLGDCVLELHQQSSAGSPEVSATRIVARFDETTKVTLPEISTALVSQELEKAARSEAPPDSDRKR